MLAVTVEGRPLNCIVTFGTPVKLNFLVMVPYSQVATLERRRKTDYQGTDLILRAWRVDIFAEETQWT